MAYEKRFRLIVELTKRIEDQKIDLGKTQLQKLIYFLQRLGENLEYRYQIYHYGPFSFELADDIERMDTFGLIDVQPDEDGYGYHITSGALANRFLENSDSLDPESKSRIDLVMDHFKDSEVSHLELLTTTHFVYCVLESREQSAVLKDELTQAVIGLKPKFGSTDVLNALEELKDKEYV